MANLALFRRVPASFEGSFFRKRRHDRCVKIQFWIPREIQFSRQRIRISTHLLGCQGNKRLNRCDGTGMTELGWLEKVELRSNEGPPPPLLVH